MFYCLSQFFENFSVAKCGLLRIILHLLVFLQIKRAFLIFHLIIV